MLCVAARTALTLALIATLTGCEAAADPPMPLPRAAATSLATSLDEVIAASVDAGADRDADADPAPTNEVIEAEVITEERLASIATETSVYEEPRWGSRRLGYLRAGGTVRRARIPVAANRRCPEGWYRVEPRGYVCVGAMATLDLGHAVLVASTPRPRLDDLPYPYVLSRSPPPLLYARLPERRDQLRFEHDLVEHLLKVPGAGAGSPPPEPIPAWLEGGRAAPSLGNRWRGADRVLLDRAHARSGFALLRTVEHAGRRFGVTTGLEVLPLDRTQPVTPSTFNGIALGDVTLPIAFVRARGAYRVIDDPQGIRPGAALGFREAVPVTDESRTLGGVEYLVAKDGTLIPAYQTVVLKPFRRLPAWSADDVKWIDVSIPKQSLVAYEGTTPVYATLVSTGVGGAGDPRETHATIQGAFKIYEKHTTMTMGGHETSDSFELREVPFVQYFNESYALHAAYWHDDFGRLHSHGCVNLAPRDAAWLFRWTDPHVPEGWHAVMTKVGGTIVYVHD